jgi:glycerate kinase
MRVVAAVDKFRGTASAAAVAHAIGQACWELGNDCTELALADGGEGLLDALGGANRTTTVTGPLGAPVTAGWRLQRGTAIIEMALASGLVLAGGPDGNDPMAATTAGTGELIDAALTAGAKRIIVGLGGSATTDGGLGALQAIKAPVRLRGVELLVACDVTTTFVDAAAVFGPQKGATPAQVRMLSGRLSRLADQYVEQFGVDVREIPGSGAAGGIAGMLAALGGQLVRGFDLVADELGLYDAVEQADLVLTGEGHLDRQSFAGKVVGGVAGVAGELGVPVGAVVGIADEDVRDRFPVIAIADAYGLDRATREPLWCIEHAARELITARFSPMPPSTAADS